MIITSKFEPAWWLPGPHLQTLGARFLTPQPEIKLRRERLESPDGDFIDIDWAEPAVLLPNEKPPIVIILHGLGGSTESHYAKPTLAALTRQGWRAAFLYFRSCSGEPNRLATSYHSGYTNDIQYVVDLIKDREPLTPLAAIGFSIGGNVLLKWLGETNHHNPLQAAIAVSVPFELGKAADRMSYGLSRLYQWRLIFELRRELRTKFKQMPSPIDLSNLSTWHTFWEFDMNVTAPLHGFKNVHDYYLSSSSRQFLKSISTPTLIIHALDDPFMTPDVIPSSDELSPSVTLELSKEGGHVGFLAGDVPFMPQFWLENRLVEFLMPQLNIASVITSPA